MNTILKVHFGVLIEPVRGPGTDWFFGAGLFPYRSPFANLKLPLG
jgi:hypothetical protein